MSRRGKTVSALIGADVICARSLKAVSVAASAPTICCRFRLASSEGTPQEMLRPLVAGISALLPRGFPLFLSSRYRVLFLIAGYQLNIER